MTLETRGKIRVNKKPELLKNVQERKQNRFTPLSFERFSGIKTSQSHMFSNGSLTMYWIELWLFWGWMNRQTLAQNGCLVPLPRCFVCRSRKVGLHSWIEGCCGTVSRKFLVKEPSCCRSIKLGQTVPKGNKWEYVPMDQKHTTNHKKSQLIIFFTRSLLNEPPFLLFGEGESLPSWLVWKHHLKNERSL